MQPLLQISKVEGVLTDLESEVMETNTPTVIAEQIAVLATHHAFISGQMAVAKLALNEKKAKVYEAFIDSGNQLTPSLAKDYIASRCNKEQYDFDICERCCRLLVHRIDAARSILSFLKEESKINNYQHTGA